MKDAILFNLLTLCWTSLSANDCHNHLNCCTSKDSNVSIVPIALIGPKTIIVNRQISYIGLLLLRDVTAYTGNNNPWYFVHPSIWPSIHLPVRLPIRPLTRPLYRYSHAPPYVCKSVCSLALLSVHTSVRPALFRRMDRSPVHLPFRLSVKQFIIHQPVRSSVRLSIYLLARLLSRPSIRSLNRSLGLIHSRGMQANAYISNTSSRVLSTACIQMPAPIINPLTTISRSSGYKLFVTRYRQPAFRLYT